MGQPRLERFAPFGRSAGSKDILSSKLGDVAARAKAFLHNSEASKIPVFANADSVIDRQVEGLQKRIKTAQNRGTLADFQEILSTGEVERHLVPALKEENPTVPSTDKTIQVNDINVDLTISESIIPGLSVVNLNAYDQTGHSPLSGAYLSGENKVTQIPPDLLRPLNR